MEFVITRDGSPTIYDPSFKEHHHSLVGAYTEARFKFAEVARPLLVSKKHIKVLDLPFGLGYNLIASLMLLDELQLRHFVDCTAIEKDFKVIEAIASCPFGEDLQSCFDHIKSLSTGQLIVETENFKLELIVDDLREALRGLNDSFDLIYFDPFSPKVAPELWSKDNVLSHLTRLLSDEGLLITYTASNKVRKAFLELGLNIAPGPAVGRKMGGTIASKAKLETVFSEEICKKIEKAKVY
jgi:tRNA U34 5-methylaminomethyl-2-thiouridine-forming methyltransferase MnmC